MRKPAITIALGGDAIVATLVVPAAAQAVSSLRLLVPNDDAPAHQSALNDLHFPLLLRHPKQSTTPTRARILTPNPPPASLTGQGNYPKRDS
jgi:hypothetical protein